MSTYYDQPLTCPSCQHTHTVPLLKGMHITRLPEVREAIRSGDFQVIPCPACGARVKVEGRTIYTDFERLHYVAVELPGSPDWPALRALHQSVFDQSFTFGPPIAEELGRSLTCRLVFGVGALQEKLLVWDAGLDDHVVEAVKGDWLKEQGKGVREELLRVIAVLDGGHLLFARLTPPTPRALTSVEVGPPPSVLGVLTLPRLRYQQRLARRAPTADYPWLATPWVVDLYHGAPT